MLITVFLIFGLFLMLIFMANYEPHRGSLWFCVKDAFSKSDRETYEDTIHSKIDILRMNLIRLPFDVSRYTGIDIEDIFVGVGYEQVFVFIPGYRLGQPLRNCKYYDRLMWDFCWDALVDTRRLHQKVQLNKSSDIRNGSNFYGPMRIDEYIEKSPFVKGHI